MYNPTSKAQRLCSNRKESKKELVQLLTAKAGEMNCVRHVLAKITEKKDELTKQLESLGIDKNNIPPKELENGHGPVLAIEIKWANIMVKHPNEQYRQSLKSLLEAVMEWRFKCAAESRVSVETILPRHLAKTIAYTQPTSVEALAACGVRTSKINELAQLIKTKSEALGLAQSRSSNPLKRSFSELEADDDSSKSEQEKVLDLSKSGKMLAPPNVWIHTKPNHRATWPDTLKRFKKGEKMQLIAVSQSSGKPIQPATVWGHLLSALEYGKPVPLQRAYEEAIQVGMFQQLTLHEWESFKKSFHTVSNDLRKPGLNDILKDILGEEEFGRRAEKRQLGSLYAKLKIFLTLTRISYEPSWKDVGASTSVPASSSESTPGIKKVKLEQQA